MISSQILGFKIQDILSHRKINQSEDSTLTNGKNSDARQPRIDVAMSRVVRPAHVTNESNATIESQKSQRENNFGDKIKNGGNVLGGKRDGISRLIFPSKKFEDQKFIKTKSGKQYKISHFFSSDED